MLKNNRRGFFATMGAVLFAPKILVTKTVPKLSMEDLECAEMLGRAAARNIDQMMWNTIKYDLT